MSNLSLQDKMLMFLNLRNDDGGDVRVDETAKQTVNKTKKYTSYHIHSGDECHKILLLFLFRRLLDILLFTHN